MGRKQYEKERICQSSVRERRDTLCSERPNIRRNTQGMYRSCRGRDRSEKRSLQAPHAFARLKAKPCKSQNEPETMKMCFLKNGLRFYSVAELLNTEQSMH